MLAYHRIDELDADPDLDPGLISATPGDFRAQMERVASDYNAISLDELVDAHRRGPAAGTSGAVDVRRWLSGFRIERLADPSRPRPARVLFVPTAFPDNAGPGFWWDRLHAALARTSSRDSSSRRSAGSRSLARASAASRIAESAHMPRRSRTPKPSRSSTRS